VRFIGIDLTDPYAKRRRDVDVAILDAAGICEFCTVPPASTSTDVATWSSALDLRPSSGDVLVIDGPLALAAPGATMRDCERLLGAPGKTPDHLPIPGSRPFAGYVRGSIELARALIASGWTPAGESAPLATATMLEAFPGASWTVLAGMRLPHKATASGIIARATLLEEHGIAFAARPRTHDQLDAALCAFLGWTLRRNATAVAAIGRYCSDPRGEPREGVIVQICRASTKPPCFSRKAS
jgi:hypothetical protein